MMRIGLLSIGKQKQLMSEGRKRELEELNREISTCKGHISATEGRIINSLTKYSTPKKDNPPNPQTQSTGGSQPNSDEQQVVSYIKNINHLRDRLQEKAYVVQVEREKERLVMQNQISRFKNANIEMEKTIKQNNDQLNLLRNQVTHLQKTIKQKQATINTLTQELSASRRENTEIKLQNKNLKADNKVVMNHIDRLTREKKVEEKKDSLAEREVRVMKSLYLYPPTGVELKQSARRHENTSELKNKVILEESTEINSELRTLIRRLNDQIDLLKHEKQVLIQQNRQKSIGVEQQLMVARLGESEKQKLNEIIHKMGDKIMNLQQINSTLKETISKLQSDTEDTDEHYYRQTKAKAGQFYYRK